MTTSSSLFNGSSSASSSAASGPLSLELSSEPAGSSGTARAGGEPAADGSRNSLWFALPVGRGCRSSVWVARLTVRRGPKPASRKAMWRAAAATAAASPAPLPTGSAAVPAGGSAAAPRRRSPHRHGLESELTTHKFEHKSCRMRFCFRVKASETGSPCPCPRWGALKVGRLGQRVLEKLVWRFRCSGSCPAM